MRVVDTSLWVEYFADGPLADFAEKSIEPVETCAVPAMVYYELVKWGGRNYDDATATVVLSLLTDSHGVAMDKIIADEAARLSLQHKLHATDAIIYATARLLNATLFTCDNHFKDLPGVEYYSKEKAAN